jgi:prepilin-type N-terminal cleavage/methylation domain-containing protein
MKPTCKKKAFSLVELMVVMAVFGFIVSASFITGTSMIKRYSDKRSDFRVEGEVEEAAAWLRSVITRALWNKSDFTLIVSADSPESLMSVKWKTTGERESWNAQNLAFKTVGNATGVFSNYSHRYQTLTPALSITVYYEDDRKTRAGWTISASGYGYVRAYR